MEEDRELVESKNSQMEPDDVKNWLNRITYLIESDNHLVNILIELLEIPADSIDDTDVLEKTDVSFKILFDLLRGISYPYQIVVEKDYVDRVYRDSYYSYYSGKHFEYSRFCKRLSIFQGEFAEKFFDISSTELSKRFVGSIVLRPLPGYSVGRTLLNPSFFLAGEHSYIRLARYNVTVFGKRLEVKAFPYSMQDGETTSCAEITILNMLDYFSRKYPEYHYLLPSQITRIVEKNSVERLLPTTGLSYTTISKIFCEAGFYPRLYAASKMKKSRFRHIMHYYIESGIPVAMGLKLKSGVRHSVIGIGYFNPDKSLVDQFGYCSEVDKRLYTSDAADCVSEYCIMNDNEMPYQMVSCTLELDPRTQKEVLMLGGQEVEYMMVPLYKKMYLEATDAYDICSSLLAQSKFSYDECRDKEAFHVLEKKYKDLSDLGSIDNPLVIRCFMTSARSYRRYRDEQFENVNKSLRDIYNYMTFPRFLWVCELYSKSMFEDGKVFGEIILDATSSADAKSDSFLLIHYPGMVSYRRHSDLVDKMGKKDTDFIEVEGWQTFDAFSGNLTVYGDGIYRSASAIDNET